MNFKHYDGINSAPVAYSTGAIVGDFFDHPASSLQEADERRYWIQASPDAPFKHLLITETVTGHEYALTVHVTTIAEFNKVAALVPDFQVFEVLSPLQSTLRTPPMTTIEGN